MINEYGAVGGMRIGRGYDALERKPTPVPAERSMSNGITSSVSILIEHMEPKR
jgi:hypothetical protein